MVLTAPARSGKSGGTGGPGNSAVTGRRAAFLFALCRSGLRLLSALLLLLLLLLLLRAWPAVAAAAGKPGVRAV